MVDIVLARGRKLRAFFQYSEKAGYNAKEQRYIRQNFAHVPMQGACLLAMKSGHVSGRIMTWADRSHRVSQRECGFFALLDGDEDTYEPLLKKAEELQLSWGSSELLGPVAPDGSSWFMGQCDNARTGGLFTGPGDRGQTAVLIRNGYTAEKSFNAYLLYIPGKNRYRDAAQRFAERLGLKSVRLTGGFFSQKLNKAVYDVETFNPSLLARQAERIKPFISTKHSFSVMDPMGKCAGYILTLKGKPIRVSTIITQDNSFRRPVTALLISEVLDSFLKTRNSLIELSVIDEENTASNRLVKAIGAVTDRHYRIYCKKLT